VTTRSERSFRSVCGNNVSEDRVEPQLHDQIGRDVAVGLMAMPSRSGRSIIQRSVHSAAAEDRHQPNDGEHARECQVGQSQQHDGSSWHSGWVISRR
jgi:hypothetical protein